VNEVEKSVDILFTEDVLHRFLENFRLESKVKKLGDFENYVFEVYREDKPLILRVTHSTHRSMDEIHAELDWMKYLNRHNVNCPRPFTSKSGYLIEKATAADGSQFFACLSSKVPGYQVKVKSEQFNEQLFTAWGKAIGQMHAVTKTYHPEKNLRPSWEEEELLNIENYVQEEPEVILNTKTLIKDLKGLPKNRDTFGLIHSDIHSGNFFYDGESVHVFDFDDCSYHWFASDIAIPLYYSIFYGWQGASVQEIEVFAKNFLTPFMEGYETYNSLPENWQEQLPLFLKLRDITLYSVLHKKIAPEDRDEQLNQLLDAMKTRIIRKEAIVNV
jgi:amicoumacin kinase